MYYIGELSTLAKNVKYLRIKKHRMNQKDFARFTGVAQSVLSKIESGKGEGGVETRVKIAEACGLTLADLYRDDLVPKGVDVDTLN